MTLIERGSADIYTAKDMSSLSREDIDKHLGIIRPLKSQEKGALPPSSPKRQTQPGAPHSEYGHYACTIAEGCLMGIEGLRAKAGLPDAWKWEGGDKGGALPPFTAAATEPVSSTAFTVEVFENLFGPCAEALKEGAQKRAGANAEEKQVRPLPSLLSGLVLCSP